MSMIVMREAYLLAASMRSLARSGALHQGGQTTKMRTAVELNISAEN